MRTSSLLRNQNGQSLVQVLVASAIMGVLLLAITSLMDNQRRLLTQVTQKMAAVDMQRVLTHTLSDPDVCTYMINNPVQAAFDPMTVGSSSPPQFSFTQIPSKGVAGSPLVASVSTTVTASPLSESLFVNAIRIADLKCVPEPCTPTSNKFSANIHVGFDNQRLVIALSNLRFPIALSSTGPANSQTLTTCSLSASGGSSIGGVARFTSSGTWVVPNGVTKVLVNAVGGGGGSGGIGNMGATGGTGGNGGSSSLQGCAVSANGGTGSVGLNGMSGSNGPGGAGGTAVGGSLNGDGAPGGAGNSSAGVGGTGGAALGGIPYASTGFGNGANGSSSGGPATGGGGGGGTSVGACNVTAGNTLNVTVGSAGTAGAATSGGYVPGWPGAAGSPGVVVLQW